MNYERLRNLTLSALFIALGIVLPFLTGQIKEIGNMLLPMHIPVFLCGLICGKRYGAVVGITVPMLRSVIFSMPVFYPAALAMAFELATYGFTVGFLYEKSPWKCIKSLYKAMLGAMVTGRVVWGCVMTLLMNMKSAHFGFYAFLSSAVIKAIPGIVLQFVFIPAVMVALKKAKLVPLIKIREKEYDRKNS